MTARQHAGSRMSPALAVAAVLSGCEAIFSPDRACILKPRQSVVVEVRDHVSAAPAARGVTGEAVHESGIVHELAASGPLSLRGLWGDDPPRGGFTVHVRRPGFRTETETVDVRIGDCGIVTEVVRVQLVPNPHAIAVPPRSFIEGPKVDAGPSSAGVKWTGNTLEIKGSAPTGCNELAIVAYRTGGGLHVQLGPSDSPLDRCGGARVFEARFAFRSEPIALLVTNATGFPATLFNGQVRPTTDS